MRPRMDEIPQVAKSQLDEAVGQRHDDRRLDQRRLTDDAGCQWPRTNGYSPPDGSWKTRCKRKSCNRPSSGTRDASSSDDSS